MCRVFETDSKTSPPAHLHRKRLEAAGRFRPAEGEAGAEGALFLAPSCRHVSYSICENFQVCAKKMTSSPKEKKLDLPSACGVVRSGRPKQKNSWTAGVGRWKKFIHRPGGVVQVKMRPVHHFELDGIVRLRGHSSLRIHLRGRRIFI